MSTLTVVELRNIAKHLEKLLDCMAHARETLDEKDYARFLEAMIGYLTEEDADCH